MKEKGPSPGEQDPSRAHKSLAFIFRSFVLLVQVDQYVYT